MMSLYICIWKIFSFSSGIICVRKNSAICAGVVMAKLTAPSYYGNVSIHIACFHKTYHMRVEECTFLSRNQKPVGFELSSNMHMYYAFDNHIHSFTSMTTHLYLGWQTISFSLFLPVIIEIVHTCTYAMCQWHFYKCLSLCGFFSCVNHEFNLTLNIFQLSDKIIREYPENYLDLFYHTFSRLYWHIFTIKR